MIALLDPALFIRKGAPDAPLAPTEEGELCTDLEGVLDACHGAKAKLADVGDYWKKLWSTVVGPLERRTKLQTTRNALRELRRLGVTYQGHAAPPLRTRVWGFRTMFGSLGLPNNWEDLLADAASRLLSVGQDIVLLTRLVEGRNLTIHHGRRHITLDEITRWRLSISPPGAQRPTTIPCIRSKSQIVRPWTARFDPRLPTDRDGPSLRYPFCLPHRWDRRNTVVFGTRNGAPAWVDRADRAWTRPDIPNGAGHHWDVSFTIPAEVQRMGTDHLNIVQYGAPEREGVAGMIHHGRDPQVGWTCG